MDLNTDQYRNAEEKGLETLDHLEQNNRNIVKILSGIFLVLLLCTLIYTKYRACLLYTSPSPRAVQNNVSFNQQTVIYKDKLLQKKPGKYDPTDETTKDIKHLKDNIK